MSLKDSPRGLSSPGGSTLDVCPCKSRKKGLSIKCTNQECSVQFWHALCAGFRKPRKQVLDTINDWICPNCCMKNLPCDTNDEHSDKFVDLYEKIDGLTKSMNEKFQFMEKIITNKLDVQGENVQKKIKTYTDAVTENMDKHCKTNEEMNKKVDKIKCDIQAKHKEDEERKEKVSKESNVIIFNIPESNEIDKKEAYTDDIKKLHVVLDEHITLKKENIEAIYRIGIKSNDKTRPIIMKLNDKETRSDLLKLRGLKYNVIKDKLCEKEDEAAKDDEKNKQTNSIKIFISPDRTKSEQDFHRKLVAKLNERKDKGEKNLYIKNGQIVQYQPFRANAQQSWAEHK